MERSKPSAPARAVKAPYLAALPACVAPECACFLDRSLVNPFTLSKPSFFYGPLGSCLVLSFLVVSFQQPRLEFFQTRQLFSMQFEQCILALSETCLSSAALLRTFLLSPSASTLYLLASPEILSFWLFPPKKTLESVHFPVYRIPHGIFHQ